MAETLRQLGLDKSRVRKGAVRPEINPSQIRGLLADLGTGIGLPFIDAASQAAQGNYGQAAISGLLDAPPVKMAGMALAPLIGMVRKSAPMDEALRIAQKNAAKPVSEGGLGLPKNNTPMDRARAMGFEDGWAHGSPANDIVEMRPSRTGAQGPGTYATNYMPETAMYTGQAEGATSYPLMVKRSEAINTTRNNPYDELMVKADDALLSELFGRGKSAFVTTQPATPDWLIKAGVPNMPQRQHFVSVKPENFRSRFAAFDPARLNEKDLLASLAALGISIPVMRGLLQEEEMQ